jgi:dephospho-CoA kinase
MPRILITGLSGTGKSTVTTALRRRGFAAVDADAPGYSHEIAVDHDEVTGIGGGRDWVWREDRMRDLLAGDEAVLFVSGTSSNQGAFYPSFDHIVLLTAPVEVMLERLATRATNDFGKDPAQRERVVAMRETIEPMLRRGADLEVETTAPVEDVVEAILRHVGIGR